MSVLGLAAALFLDRVLGEVNRMHPLVSFGNWASRVEASWRPGVGEPATVQIRAGAIAWVLLVIFPTLVLVVLLSSLGDIVLLLQVSQRRGKVLLFLRHT